MVSKKFPGKFNCLGEICEFITREAKAAGLDEKEIYAVQLAVDEACTNIIEHAYGGEGKGDIELICKVVNDGMEIVLKDDGEPFDPDLITEPKIGLPLEEVEPRGAGIFLIRKLMDEVIYEFSSGKGTVLKMKKMKRG